MKVSLSLFSVFFVTYKDDPTTKGYQLTTNNCETVS